MKDIELIEVIRWMIYKAEFIFWLGLVFVVFFFVVSKASAIEEDPRHQLCAEGKLPMLNGIGSIVDKTFFKPETEVLYITDYPFYVETTKNGKKIAGYIPAGIPISAKKGNPWAEHFATKGWRMIHNRIPMSVAVVLAPTEKSEPKKEEQIVKKPFLAEDKSQFEKKLLLGLSNDVWRKFSYCAGSVALGYGAKSGKKEFIGGGTIVVGITLYFDSEKSIADQFSWEDVGVGLLCGTVGYYAGPSKKEDSSSSSTNSESDGSTGSSPGGPGPDPVP